MAAMDDLFGGAMDQATLQLSFFVGLSVIGAAGYLLPVLMLKRDLNKGLAIRVANVFTCGILMAMTLITMMPGAERSWTRAVTDQHGWLSSFPISNFIVLVAFTCLLFLERWALNTWTSPSVTLTPAIIITSPSPPPESKSQQSRFVFDCKPVQDQVQVPEPSSDRQRVRDLQEVSGVIGDSSGFVTVLLLLTSVMWHTIFEGLILGMHPNATSAIPMFVGIMVHGFLMALAVSGYLISVWNPTASVSLVCCLAMLVACRPFGFVLGCLMHSQTSYTSLILTSVLQSLSAGIFLHITFMSLIPSAFGEMTHQHPAVAPCHVRQDDQPPESGSELHLGWKMTAFLMGVSLVVIGSHQHVGPITTPPPS